MFALQVEMLRKGLKEIGILKDGDNSLYHQLNPTSIGFHASFDMKVPSVTIIRHEQMALS